MAELTYQEALSRINDLEPRGWRLGLDRMEAFCGHANLTPYLGSGNSRFIHIAGTNGKGSTTAHIESLLRSGGVSTGAFFSPFVRDYRERIQANGKLISETDLAFYTSTLLAQLETFEESEYGGITKFEFETALGFLYWGEKNCDWVALEVGLGGRLDATNVVTPACSVIVSIGLDHTAILGNSIEEIAAEKAGIIKHSIPLIVGQVPPGALKTIQHRAHALEAPMWRFGQEIVLEESEAGFKVHTPVRTYAALHPGLTGLMQPHNLALSVAALDACGIIFQDDEIKRGAESTYAPGRFERKLFEGVQFVVDGAHNAEAATALLFTLAQEFRGIEPWILVANSLSGHDAELFYETLQGHFNSVEVAPIAAPRALHPKAGERMATQFFEDVTAHFDLETAIRAAMDKAGKEGLVVVTGSNYLAGDVLNLIESSLQDIRLDHL